MSLIRFIVNVNIWTLQQITVNTEVECVRIKSRRSFIDIKKFNNLEYSQRNPLFFS